MRSVKEYLDATYPHRHELILGDSLVTVLKYIQDHPGVTFDLIFVDGGHEYACAYGDLVHSSKLAHKNTIVVMDDIVYDPAFEAGYTIGPTRAWSALVKEGVIEELEYVMYSPGRGQAVGRFLREARHA